MDNKTHAKALLANMEGNIFQLTARIKFDKAQTPPKGKEQEAEFKMRIDAMTQNLKEAQETRDTFGEFLVKEYETD